MKSQAFVISDRMGKEEESKIMTLLFEGKARTNCKVSKRAGNGVKKTQKKLQTVIACGGGEQRGESGWFSSLTKNSRGWAGRVSRTIQRPAHGAIQGARKKEETGKRGEARPRDTETLLEYLLGLR